ncbi:MAG: universal stress protein [Alphaproteobacteria bacterium]|nr:MAG: universal stress protein [Alphaproteobacteria bacterium]
MYKNILIPVDIAHGEINPKVIEAARALGDKDAKYTFLYVMDVIPSYIAAELPEDVFARNRQVAEERLEEEVKAAGLEGERILKAGHAATEILDLIESKGIDCVVIASHRPGLRDYFLGSTAARVVRHAPCSVHVVR